MKKYFMKGTDDEVREGDVIEVSLVGEEEGVKKHSHLEIKFMPEFADDLIEEEIIEEREVEEEDDDLLDFSDEDFQGFREAVAQDIEELNEKYAVLLQRIECHEDSSLAQKETLDAVYGSRQDKKTASLRKK